MTRAGENDVAEASGGGQDRRQFTHALLREVHALDRMLAEGRIESGVRRIGAEQEMFLVDRNWKPAPVALEILDAVDDPHLVTEVGAFNLELNLDPQGFGGNCFSAMEAQLNELLARVRSVANERGVDVLLAGILPTIRTSDLGLSNMVDKDRYHRLNAAISNLRGTEVDFYIKGVDELRIRHDSVMVEACNASFQVHLQVDAATFANQYNIAQFLAGPVLACATNSPLLFGRRLWAETRIAVFQQAVDTRRPTHHMRDVGPRVTFGDRWLRSSILELYREDISRFPPLLPDITISDPFEALARGEAPDLAALRLHTGTVWRWNRGCYGISEGVPHVRIENRVLPAGPTTLDEVANAALWLGVMVALAERQPDIAADDRVRAGQVELRRRRSAGPRRPADVDRRGGDVRVPAGPRAPAAARPRGAHRGRGSTTPIASATSTSSSAASTPATPGRVGCCSRWPTCAAAARPASG